MSEVEALHTATELLTDAMNDKHKITALIDSGCMTSSIDRKLVKELGLVTERLPRPIPVINADGTQNKGGAITERIRVRLSMVTRLFTHHEQIELLVTELSSPLFLGHDWLSKHNPSCISAFGSSLFYCPERLHHGSPISVLTQSSSREPRGA